MSVIYLYYTEDANFGGSLSAAFAVPMLDQFALMYGGELACIHPVNTDYPATVATQFATLEDAQKAYPSHEWLYLDHNASDSLDDYVHPADNVVYVAGHDRDGFGSSVIGRSVKLKTLQVPFVGHAIPSLIALACDRRSRVR